MKFEILEEFTLGKASTGYSEDRLVRSKHHFGVLDGSRGPKDIGQAVITSILDSACQFIQDMPEDMPLTNLIEALTEITARAKTAAGTQDFKQTGGFVFCLYSSHHKEIWRVGDCKFRLNGQENAVMFAAEEVCASARALILKAKLNAGLSQQEIMTTADYTHLIDDLLVHEASFLNLANDPLGIGAIIGTAVPGPYVERFPAEEGHLVITSDGYPALFDTLSETETTLTDLLDKDPLCILENKQCKGLAPGLKSFDDRTFISAKLV